MFMYILRGLPGSGKSTWARTRNASVYSADDFFYKNNEYVFDRNLLAEAHQSCFRKVIGDISGQNINDVIVDNTNMTLWECSPYVLAGESYGYTVITVNFMDEIDYGNGTDTFIKMNVNLLAKRNIHGVTAENIYAMACRWEHKLPWWKEMRVLSIPR